MPKLLTAEEAVIKLARNFKREKDSLDDEMPECWSDKLERMVEHLESTLRKCRDVPQELRPKNWEE
jgi:hypothetical protein